MVSVIVMCVAQLVTFGLGYRFLHSRSISLDRLAAIIDLKSELADERLQMADAAWDAYFDAIGHDERNGRMVQ